ncbi:hypothetical protein BC833DRAFT_28334 [Globomyces pollinis-pini]|nr:hypothetical protein BC833DRAFT_28334 [Globomyces pollinis-pini]
MVINTVESPMDLPLKIQHLSSKEWDTVENTLMDLTTSFMDFNWSTKLYILNTILKKTIINWPNISLERQKTLIYPLFLSKCNHEVLLNVFDHAKTKHSDISLFILKLYLDSFTLHDILQCIFSECKSTLARQGNWNNAVHIFTSISDLFPFHFVRSLEMNLALSLATTCLYKKQLYLLKECYLEDWQV